MATVIEKISEEIRDAYYGRTPFIMLDTFETGLAREAALKADVIELTVSSELPAPKDKGYYRLIGKDEDYRQSVNFSRSCETLDRLCENGCSPLGKDAVQPQLILLDLLPKADINEKIIEALRRYKEAYNDCIDDHSAIRSSIVIITGDPALLPADVLLYTKIISVPYPTLSEIRSMLPDTSEEEAENIASRLAGLSLMQIRDCIKKLERLGVTHIKEKRNRVIYEIKLQNLRRCGSLLTLYEPKGKSETSVDSIGGMANIKKYIKKIEKDIKTGTISITPSGVGHYKGVLLVGVPGCGKSFIAEVLHKELGITMLKLDMNRMMNSYVGESEKALEKALEQAEALSPCILWIDELDKGLSGATSDSGDGGLFKRLFGYLLQWLSKEKQSPCFVYATANDITGFPPELFRSGRFDAVFGAFMPTAAECREILRNLMVSAENKRAEDYKALGKQPPCPLFRDDCKDETTLDSLLLSAINPVYHPNNNGKDETTHNNGKTKAKPKFLTGADIQKIVKEAVMRLGPVEHTPIAGTDWAHALCRIIADPFITTEGYGDDKLNKITACYVRILRGSAIPTDTAPLFSSESYESNTDSKGISTAKYTGSCPSTHPYDTALFGEISKRLPCIASGIENNAFIRDTK